MLTINSDHARIQFLTAYAYQMNQLHSKADQKVSANRLGQMLYADLLLAKVGPLAHIGSG